MAKRVDSRGKRPLLKLLLKDDAEAKHAADIVAWWRTQRSAAMHVTRAIRMYYGLMSGNDALLREYFPFIGRSDSAPSAFAEPVAEPPKITSAPKRREREFKADEGMDDFLNSLGI